MFGKLSSGNGTGTAELSSATYKDLSIVAGIAAISVPNSCSILYKLKRSFQLIKLMARPK